ncbi:MAG: hypothetical protein AAGD00_10470 [Planctomycetota bacterium]
MRTHRLTTQLLAPLGLSALLLATPTAVAQPADVPPAHEQVRSPERMTEFLLRRVERNSKELAELQQEQATLEAAVARLDAGEDPEEVAQILRELRRQKMTKAFEGAERAIRGRAHRGEQDLHRGPHAEVDTDRVLEFIGDHNPDLHKRLAELRANNPEAFEEMVGKRAEKLRAVVGKARDAAGLGREMMEQRRELDREIKRTVEGLQSPEEALVDPTLRGLIEERIDLESRFQQEKIDRMTRYLEELENELDAQVADRDSIVTEKLIWIAESLQKRESSQD